MKYVKVNFNDGVLHTIIYSESNIEVDNDNDLHSKDNLSLYEVIRFASNIIREYMNALQDTHICLLEAQAFGKDIKQLMEYELNIGEGSLKPIVEIKNLEKLIPNELKDIVANISEEEQNDNGMTVVVWLKFPYISTTSGTGYFHCSSENEFIANLKTIKPIVTFDDLQNVESENYSEFASNEISLTKKQLWNETIKYWKKENENVIRLKNNFITYSTFDWDQLYSPSFIMNIDGTLEGEIVLIQVAGEVNDLSSIRIYIETYDEKLDGEWWSIKELFDEEDCKTIYTELTLFVLVQYIKEIEKLKKEEK